MIARPPRTRTLPLRRRRSRIPPLRGYFPEHEKTRRATFRDRQPTGTIVSLEGKHPAFDATMGRANGARQNGHQGTQNTRRTTEKTLSDYCAQLKKQRFGGGWRHQNMASCLFLLPYRARAAAHPGVPRQLAPLRMRLGNRWTFDRGYNFLVVLLLSHILFQCHFMYILPLQIE